MKSSSLGSKPERRKKLPVFVFPEELQFCVEDETTHKQILTIYNPYDFNIRFQVLSNAPKKYAVVECQGSIKAHCCVDIVVRHKSIDSSSPNVTDKFRVDTYVGNKLVGQKQVLASVVKVKQSQDSIKEKPGSFVSLSESGASVEPGFTSTERSRGRPYHPPHQQGPSYLVMALGLLCLLVLLFPLEGESPGWPHYSHVSVNQKLIAAFALGLITMALLKS